MTSLPPERQLFYFLIACFLPLLLVFGYLWPEKQSIETMESRMARIQKVEQDKKRRQSLNASIKEKYSGSDRYYIDKQLENLRFLAPEKESLERLLSNSDFPQDEILKKRLAQLNGPSNQLAFSEGAPQQYAYFRETVETLLHPVEIDSQDLQSILSRVEGVPLGEKATVPPGRPQLIILDFKLQRKPNPSGADVFSLDMKLLKREFS